MSKQCSCVNPKTSRRCRNEAWREIRVHQENEHPIVGTGWFWVNVCQYHFFKSNAQAVVNLKGRQEWRNLP